MTDPEQITNDQQNRRRRARSAIAGRLPVLLVNDQQEQLTYFPVDVSEEGLGVIFDLEVKAGQLLRLIVPGNDAIAVTLKIVWVTQPYQALGVFRAGLWEVDGKVNLRELLANFPSVIIDDLS